MMSVDLTTESGLRAGKPRMQFERTLSRSAVDSGAWGHIYAVFPDGKRFLFVENDEQPEVRELKVVLKLVRGTESACADQINVRVRDSVVSRLPASARTASSPS